MKSKIINRKPIDTTNTIVVQDVQVDPQNIEMHRQRINTIFAGKSEDYRLEQINKMIMHDILFSQAMNHLFKHYEFEIDPSEQEKFAELVISEWKKRSNQQTKTNSSKQHDDQNSTANEQEFVIDEQSKELAKMAASKLIIQNLILEDIQQQNNITVDDKELEKILLDYYQNTNQPIRSFKQNPENYENARKSIIHEKTINYILSMFKFDLDKFNKELEEFVKKNNLQPK